MAKLHVYQKFYVLCKSDYNLFTCSIRTSEINNIDCITKIFHISKENTQYAFLKYHESKFEFGIKSSHCNLKCSVWMFIGSETCLYSNSLNEYTLTVSSNYHYYDLINFTSNSKYFQKLQQHPNETLSLICRIIKPPAVPTTDASMDCVNYLNTLGAALENSSDFLSQKKVVLQVGEETETVSKSVLCAVSPVFTKIFQNDMKESEDNLVIITDISMPVLRALVSFLYSGMLPKLEFDFLCDLYYAADKYGITDLCHRSADLLLSEISMKNILKALKLAFSHNIEWLKSGFMSLICVNIETVTSTSDWIDFMDDEPKIAVEVLQHLKMLETSLADGLRMTNSN